MPYATKSQIERARQPDLLTFLRRYKPDELIPTGPNAYKLRSHDSLKISNGKWCWWSHDKMGGVNALEYLIKVENMKFPDAVQLINEQCGVSASHEERPVSVPKAERPKAEFLLPVRFQNNRRVTAYLLSRGIDMAVLDYCFQHGLLYEAADYHNAVFVGYDGKTPRYATLRGTLSGSGFKRDVTGSNKRFCFSITGQNGSKLNVFECAIDALSYTVTAQYSGEVEKVSLNKVQYVAVFHGTPLVVPEVEVEEAPKIDWRYLAIPGGLMLLCLAGFTAAKIKNRKKGKHDDETILDADYTSVENGKTAGTDASDSDRSDHYPGVGS